MFEIIGDPGWIRTSDLQLRRLLLLRGSHRNNCQVVHRFESWGGDTPRVLGEKGLGTRPEIQCKSMDTLRGVGSCNPLGLFTCYASPLGTILLCANIRQ